MTKFLKNQRGVVSIELALVTPVLLGMLAIVVTAGQGFLIQRNVTKTARTLIDLASQLGANITASSLNLSNDACQDIIGAASLVINPYNDNNLSMTLSEVSIPSTGPIPSSITATWSYVYTNGSASATSNLPNISLPTGGTFNPVPGTYIVVGTVTYNYTPFGVLYPSGTIGLSQTLWMTPRSASSITCP